MSGRHCDECNVLIEGKLYDRPGGFICRSCAFIKIYADRFEWLENKVKELEQNLALVIQPKGGEQPYDEYE